MYLAHIRVCDLAPFGDISFPFRDPEGEPRLMTIVHGGGGVGKTSLLHVLAHTRPGHAAVLVGRSTITGGENTPHAVCEWMLGADDPGRPHGLTVITPNVRPAEDDELANLRRREQVLFDRRARQGGFVFLAISATRWFSRQPVALHAPARTVAHYDVRSTPTLDDAARSDLTREVKQALAYADIASALAPHTQAEGSPRREQSRGTYDTRLLGTAMYEIVDALVHLTGHHYEGINPTSLEPTFRTLRGKPILFEQLPTQARHLVAFAALPIRVLWAAYPGRDPRLAEGVIAIDEIDLHQDAMVCEQLVGTLRQCLPHVQWILTTSSPVMAASVDARQVLALRRLPDDEHIELFIGQQARTH